MKLRHRHGMYQDTIANCLECLRLIDGSTPKVVAKQLFVTPHTVRGRIRKLERMTCGRLADRTRGGNKETRDFKWHLTEFGRKVLEDNPV